MNDQQKDPCIVRFFPGAEAMLAGKTSTGSFATKTLSVMRVAEALAALRADMQVLAVESGIDVRDLQVTSLALLADLCVQLRLDEASMRVVFGVLFNEMMLDYDLLPADRSAAADHQK